MHDPKASSRNQGQLHAVAQWLHRPGGRIGRLLTQARHLAQVNQVLLDALPARLVGHATLTRLGPDGWVIQTDSPVWATRLRYGLARLHRQLEDTLGAPVPPLRIRIAPPAAPAPLPPPRRMLIPYSAAHLLERAARDLDDRRLRAALLRLARHVRQRNRHA